MKIAVVAKPPLHQHVVCNVLERLGFDDIISLARAQEALKLIERESIDVLVTDKDLPGMNGYALAKLVRSKQGSEYTPILLLGDDFTQEETIKAINSGVNQLLPKPVHPEDLKEKITAMRDLRRRW